MAADPCSATGGRWRTETAIVEGVWVEVDGVRTRATFGGNPDITIASGANGAWTDDILLSSDISAERLVTIYTSFSTTTGGSRVPVYQIGGGRLGRSRCRYAGSAVGERDA